MKKPNYYSQMGGLPAQDNLMTGRAVFTNSYAVIPKGVMADIVTSFLPHWNKARFWILARPLSGFAETFSQYITEVEPSGGSDNPEQDLTAQSVLFIVEGKLQLIIDGKSHIMSEGGYAYIPAGSKWSVLNKTKNSCKFHWIRKSYETVEGIKPPKAFVTNEKDIKPSVMPQTEGKWSTTRFVNSNDMSHDMHVNIVNFEPGGVIPFEETHVMEHGLYVLEGKAVYKLNQDWVEVEAGDFMWLRAFCPQACYAGGQSKFRYLLYKDVNRAPKLML
ncbi:MAG: (S)-ureidoglycine aminohydrolase [Rhizobiales bacterium]|nr:(S)-ureidoglycine aminohydrolase [Hyphomicrobiales bacterium]